LDRKKTGKSAFLGGQNAEVLVAREYVKKGAVICKTRWRCQVGEIDLILTDAKHIYFVEVKFSASHGRAAARSSVDQVNRILGAAELFIGQAPHFANLEPRFDAALVDRLGQIAILENGLADFVMI
jgi:putative endonuclease